MWRPSLLSSRLLTRRFSSTARLRIVDEGDWFYSSEWWDVNGHTVLRSTSDKGNGVVSVLAHPSSLPSEAEWAKTENWLKQRYLELNSGGHDQNVRFRVLGYQWRTLRFNDDTRQSTVKVMAAYKESEPGSICLMQQPHCVAVPYLKSMYSVGLCAMASCNYDLEEAIWGKKKMRVLCIGHGGGTLPLFLASKIRGAEVHIVEIDPLVISASIQAMGFPAFSVMNSSNQRVLSKPSTIDEVLWKGIHERLYLYESDAEKFVLNTDNIYDIIFIDAYDGDDIFPRKLWDPESPFLNALSKRLHPKRGTVVVNLHSDSDVLNENPSVSYFYQQLLPMSKHVGKVCRAYKDILIGDRNQSRGKEGIGLGFTVSVPWVCNTSLVVCRGFDMKSRHFSQDAIINAVVSKSFVVENALKLPFSCLEYIKRGFTVVD